MSGTDGGDKKLKALPSLRLFHPLLEDGLDFLGTFGCNVKFLEPGGGESRSNVSTLLLVPTTIQHDVGISKIYQTRLHSKKSCRRECQDIFLSARGKKTPVRAL